jgi:hypothetical protein
VAVLVSGQLVVNLVVLVEVVVQDTQLNSLGVLEQLVKVLLVVMATVLVTFICHLAVVAVHLLLVSMLVDNQAVVVVMEQATLLLVQQPIMVVAVELAVVTMPHTKAMQAAAV